MRGFRGGGLTNGPRDVDNSCGSALSADRESDNPACSASGVIPAGRAKTDCFERLPGAVDAGRVNTTAATIDSSLFDHP